MYKKKTCGCTCNFLQLGKSLLINRNQHYSKSAQVRVRFAPSPTGYLHLGGLRTALYNFLFAQSHNGKFILRIEDTDQSRIVEGAREALQKDLNWAGIYIDEGPGLGGAFGPYIQSQRLGIYRQHADVLLKNGSVYKCFCTERRLNLLRAEAMRAREVPKYDNKCIHLTQDEIKVKMDRGEAYCLRFKLTDGVEGFNDLIYGHISYNVALNEGDPVIVKSDGFPTYHFANVVDDRLMNVSHVLRGVEWQVSTTKHIMLYRAFNWQPPQFGHLPLLLNIDGTKLSKRQGDIQIGSYRDRGVMPLALINFIVNSGGGFDKDLAQGLKPKIHTLDELTKQFDLSKVNSHSGKLMTQRLDEFNRLELERQMTNNEDIDVLIGQVRNLIKAKFPERVKDSTLQLDENYIKSVLKWCLNRINSLNDLLSHDLSFLWVTPKCNQILSEEELLALKELSAKLESSTYEDDLSKNNLKECFKNVAAHSNIQFIKFMKLLRSILSGLEEGPGVADMIIILGKENTLSRLKFCIQQCQVSIK